VRKEEDNGRLVIAIYQTERSVATSVRAENLSGTAGDRLQSA
jgi:hypothetical protein